MSAFNSYVDDLAKRGLIDGNIADILTAKHAAEVANPLDDVMDKVRPILDDMWSDCHGGDPRTYADKIDDALEALKTAYESVRKRKVNISCSVDGECYRLVPDGSGKCTDCAFCREGEGCNVPVQFNDFDLCADLDGVWKLADDKEVR